MNSTSAMPPACPAAATPQRKAQRRPCLPPAGPGELICLDSQRETPPGKPVASLLFFIRPKLCPPLATRHSPLLAAHCLLPTAYFLPAESLPRGPLWFRETCEPRAATIRPRSRRARRPILRLTPPTPPHL